MREGTARILVVEDDPLARRLVGFLLDHHGYRVDSAPDAAGALGALGRGRVDLVLLDVHLPGVGGFELLRTIKRNYPMVPVIMLTARVEMGDRIAGLEAGADDYVTKPFEPAELASRVAAVLRGWRRARGARVDEVVG